jgi:hypothetical protein
MNRDLPRPIRRATRPTESTPNLDLKPAIPHKNRRIGNYSAAAAAANEAFGFAADIMKSEIRGTISDLKREPLKTP